ncbi:MAG: HAD-IB family hydrolase [Chloroflexota bacterium]|nr:HAD-IB family hydrolase [Chloroflexota bacterium]
MIAAIFDLDGTLYSGHIFRGLVRYHQAHHIRRLPFYVALGAQVATWPLWLAGVFPETKLRELSLDTMGWIAWGWTKEEADQAFSWVAHDYVAPRVYPEVLARLRHHQSAGHRVILVSGTFAPLLAAIGRQLDISDTVGTPLILRNGHYTGRCEHPLCQGKGKWLRLQSHVVDDAVDWQASYAYADSHTDIPLLEKVGHPVAVEPDPELAAHARAHDWEILELSAQG